MPLRELNLSDFLGVTNIGLLELCEHLSLMRRHNQFGKGQPNKHLACLKKTYIYSEQDELCQYVM